MKNPDEDHLRLLSVFYYVLAAMSGLAGCCPLFYVILGVAIMIGFDGDANPPPPELGAVIATIAALCTLFIWVMCLLEVLAARSLSRHSNYRYCFILACIELLNVPLGTVLGVFTILVLSRSSVKALYEGIPYRDPRMAALDVLDDDIELPARPPEGPDDGSIRKSRSSD